MKCVFIVLFELRSRFKKTSTYLYFILFSILAYTAIFTALLGGGPLKNFLNAGVGSVQANAPYVLHHLITILSSIGIFIAAAYFGNAACKDFKENSHELSFSYPVKKSEYLAGRFLAAFLSSLFVFSGAGIGALLVHLVPFVNPEKLGPLKISALLRPYFTGVVPNLLFIGALFFSIALLTRRTFPAYMASVGLFMGYIIGLSLLQSRSPVLASLLDPFGQVVVRDLYSYWTIAQKNSLLAATSEDTIRSRSWTGKTCRMLKNEWTEAWERPDTPDPLGMPLQGMVTSDGMRRTSTYADVADCQKVAFNPCGQVIGQINEVESCRQVIYRLLDEYVDAVQKAGSMLPEV